MEIRLGLTGWPIANSRSPALHRAALRAAGLEGAYRLYPVRPGAQATTGLRDLLDRMRAGEIDGLNITIPHKQTIIDCLDELTPTARAIGAVNTVLSIGERLVGDNTDAAGFLADLSQLGQLQAAQALVLGAGGSARAVVYALSRNGWVVHVSARRPEQAENLAADLTRGTDPDRIRPGSLDIPDLARLSPAVSLVVNTTPVGMDPISQASPWPVELTLPPAARVYDLVYNPPETAFVRAARLAGLRARGGTGMLVEQAALAFELWTGRQADREAMWRGLDL